MRWSAVLGAVSLALLAGASSSSARQLYEPTYLSDSSPLWSADGTKIAFLRNSSGSWTVRTVGVTAGGVDLLGTLPAGASDPVLSPDWSKVAFTFENGLRIMRVDGSSFRQISGLSTGGGDWSRDSRYLAVTSMWAKVVVVDTETGATTEVADGRDPAWSPDGSQLAFVSGTDVDIANRDGTGRRVVRAGTQWSGPPAWSPDRQRLAFPSDHSLWVVKLDGTVLAQKSGNYVTNRGASWSSDGTKLGVRNEPGLSIFDLRTGKEKWFRGNYSTPAWAPSPDLFAVAHVGPCSSAGIHVVSATSGAKRRLTLGCLIDGTSAGETLEGSDDCELIRGRRGNDRIFGYGCADTIHAGPGDDWVTGGPYQEDEGDYIDGGPGNDVLDGGRAPQSEYTLRDDLLLGRAGADVLRGGPGQDVLTGGKGNDTIHARDGEPDRIDCGPGRDIALVDKLDRVAANCETVRLRAR
jgi:Tol biopolymer transport system component